MPKPLMCAAETLHQDLSGKTYVVTGANSGIGLETAKQLLQMGATVVLACRRTDEGEAQIREMPKFSGKAEVMKLDLASLASVRSFASELLQKHPVLHGLVNNAGVMNSPQSKTKDGFEMQFGVNHLGHFLLTNLLLDALKAGAPSRIVNLSSCYHDKAMGREGKIDLDDPNFEKRNYDGWLAYAQSKLANLLHAKELSKRLEGTGVVTASVHPGWVRTTLIRHSLPVFVQDYIARPFLHMAGMIEPWEGAQTSLHALLASDVENHSGEFFSQTGMYRDSSCNKGGWPMRSPNPNAHDELMAAKLWDLSERLTATSS